MQEFTACMTPCIAGRMGSVSLSLTATRLLLSAYDTGGLLVHDYFSPGYMGVEKAVVDYEKEIDSRLLKLSIGDHCSIAIVKE